MDSAAPLDELLASAAPVLVPDRFVYVTIAGLDQAGALEPICIFHEAEAITAICRLERAEKADLKFGCVFRQITLQVHSPLLAVGFMAAISAALAGAGIPCNAVSAYYHDHIFVPEEKALQAIEVLVRLAHTARRSNHTLGPTPLSATPAASSFAEPPKADRNAPGACDARSTNMVRRPTDEKKNG